MRRLPKRWKKYLPVGCPVPGTRFLPFKVPLKMELCQDEPEDEWFTPSSLVESTPMLKAVIDLTDTYRYYDSEEFTSQGILYKKIKIMGGGKLPSVPKRKEFFDAVDQLYTMLDHDSDALIGVHCTHGLNRTGYLICKYMVLRMKIDPQEAINRFQEARGYQIERDLYLSDIMSQSRRWQADPQTSQSRRWQTDPQTTSTSSRSSGPPVGNWGTAPPRLPDRSRRDNVPDRSRRDNVPDWDRRDNERYKYKNGDTYNRRW
jgi:atypical dual specificity phosphatase